MAQHVSQQCNPDEDGLPMICHERFKRYDARLEDNEDILKEHTEKLACNDSRFATIEANVNNLTKSLNSVSRALWAVAMSIFGVLFGFLVWYIQNIKK